MSVCGRGISKDCRQKKCKIETYQEEVIVSSLQGRWCWLHGQGSDSENVDVYSEFVKEIDTVLMGWNTYDQATTELSLTEWIYSDFTTYQMAITVNNYHKGVNGNADKLKHSGSP